MDIVEESGIIMATGALLKPHDPRSDKYKASATFAPAAIEAVDLSVPVGLVPFRPAILNQQDIGACAMFSDVEAVYTMENAARVRAGKSLGAELAHPGYLYEKVRKLRGWWPNDTGSYPADGLDGLMVDTPLMSRYPYRDDAAYDYPDEVFVNVTAIDYLQSYRYIYVEDGNALELMHVALEQGCGLIFCMTWPRAFFNPVNGLLPEGVQWTPDDSGHALSGWGMFPTPGGIVLGAQNHWTSGWNQRAANLGNGFRAGDVGIPESFFRPGKNSPIFQIIAVSPEPVVPDPVPPANSPAIQKVKYKQANKLVVIGTGIVPASVLRVDGTIVTTLVDEGTAVAKKLMLGPGSHSVTVINPAGVFSAPFGFAI